MQKAASEKARDPMNDLPTAAELRAESRDRIADLEKQNAMLRKGMDMVNEQLIEAVAIIRTADEHIPPFGPAMTTLSPLELVNIVNLGMHARAFLSRNSHLIRNPFEDGPAEDQGADLGGPNSSPNEERS